MDLLFEDKTLDSRSILYFLILISTLSWANRQFTHDNMMEPLTCTTNGKAE